jgi:amidase
METPRTVLAFDDPFGAFVRANQIAVDGSDSGSLRGLTFAVKDAIDIAGARTGFGNPEWLRTHGPATKTAVVVQRLLDAGANMVGKTHTDELAYSLSGENVHYGTPRNPRDAARIPGGSSNGSAAAVAGGLVDFALGTDCGGSVRLPASYCGIIGFRPTHGRIPVEGVIPFGPSFDVVGWFSRNGAVLRAVGETLLDPELQDSPPRRVLIARDAFGLVDPAIAAALARPVAEAVERVGGSKEVVVSATNLDHWRAVFQTIQAAEIWRNHGNWIEQHNPGFGPGVKERFELASRVSASDLAQAHRDRAAIVSRLDTLIGEGDVLVLPTAPRIAPLRNLPVAEVEVAYRNQAIALLCIAGLGGLPQVSLPLAEIDGLPLGLSIVGRRGSDEALLDLAVDLLDGSR